VTSPDTGRTITATSIVVASKDQVASDLAGETILLSLQTAKYYGLDQVGARVWELMREPISVAQICEAIGTEYDVEPDQCERDIIALLHQLDEQELIEIENGPTTT
jgi:hypothetical protein